MKTFFGSHRKIKIKANYFPNLLHLSHQAKKLLLASAAVEKQEF
jgi:hypothetical protein